jgi:hypothetical protein
MVDEESPDMPDFHESSFDLPKLAFDEKVWLRLGWRLSFGKVSHLTVYTRSPELLWGIHPIAFRDGMGDTE